MTETCGPHTYDRMDVDLPERLRGFVRPRGAGRRAQDRRSRDGRDAAAGEFGEICVRGYSVMLGLHKQERDDVFDRDGYYHTGDAGYFDADGVLYFKARLGEMIKTAGANVTPREVEVEIERFPEVSSAFVVGLPDPVRGQNVAAAWCSSAAHSSTPRPRARGCASSSRATRCRATGGSRRRKSCRSRQRQDRQEAARRAVRGAARLEVIMRFRTGFVSVLCLRPVLSPLRSRCRARRRRPRTRHPRRLREGRARGAQQQTVVEKGSQVSVEYTLSEGGKVARATLGRRRHLRARRREDAPGVRKRS
jgi:acyl-CoA synthetase (AMP-forming)/AMP-acid ligase II